jgi:hypothetical protein
LSLLQQGAIGRAGVCHLIDFRACGSVRNLVARFVSKGLFITPVWYATLERKLEISLRKSGDCDHFAGRIGYELGTFRCPRPVKLKIRIRKKPPVLRVAFGAEILHGRSQPSPDPDPRSGFLPLAHFDRTGWPGAVNGRTATGSGSFLPGRTAVWRPEGLLGVLLRSLLLAVM